MSTILKTLKKLEEEKSVLEKRLDLKDMVLQEEDSSYPISSLKTYPRFIWGGTLFLTGVAVTAFWLWVDNPQNIQISSISRPNSFKLRLVLKNNFIVKKSINSIFSITIFS